MIDVLELIFNFPPVSFVCMSFRDISSSLGLPVSSMLIAFRLCDVIREDQLVHDYIFSVTVSFVEIVLVLVSYKFYFYD